MKALGKSLFAVSGTDVQPVPQYERVLAADMALKESWFRDAIFRDPELVLGPCREAKRLPPDEEWFPWAIEHNFGAGPMDVMLLSSHGRVAIIETKLSYNPQKRREVVAQILDYALAIQDVQEDELPPLPAAIQSVHR